MIRTGKTSSQHARGEGMLSDGFIPHRLSEYSRSKTNMLVSMEGEALPRQARDPELAERAAEPFALLSPPVRADGGPGGPPSTLTRAFEPRVRRARFSRHSPGKKPHHARRKLVEIGQNWTIPTTSSEVNVIGKITSERVGSI